MSVQKIIWIEDVVESFNDVKLTHLRGLCFGQLLEILELAQLALDDGHEAKGFDRDAIEAAVRSAKRGEARANGGIFSMFGEERERVREPDPPTAAMMEALSLLRTHGALYRWWGGYWSPEKPSDSKAVLQQKVVRVQPRTMGALKARRNLVVLTQDPGGWLWTATLPSGAQSEGQAGTVQ